MGHVSYSQPLLRCRKCLEMEIATPPMDEVQHPRACRFCGQELSLQLAGVCDPQSRELFQIFECRQCHHGTTWPVPADLGPYYGKQYHGGRHGRTAEHCARRRVRLVNEVGLVHAGRRLLDVGCGDGTFLLAAKNRGWQVTGTEMNPDLARAAGLEVYGSLDELAGCEPFDCITLWHVLEHLVDPLAELTALRKLLAPDSVLVLAVPDAGGTQARLWGRSWLHRDVPRHLHHFSRRSLELHLHGAGFRLARVWHGEIEYDLLGWSQSALNRLFPAAPNAFFELLTGRPTELHGARRAGHLVLGTMLTGLAVPLTWWGMLARSSGTLIVAARPA